MTDRTQFLLTESISSTKRKVLRILPDKVVFEAILQTADEPNRNKRVYSKRALEEALENKMQTLSGNPRGFIGELDHPNITDYRDEQAVESRLTNVLWERVSHVITKYWWKDNSLWARVESTLAGYGKEIVKIIKDDIPLGFSLRAMGKGDSEDGLLKVNKIDYLVSYDAVTTPSHSAATFKVLDEERYYKLQESLNVSAMKNDSDEKVRTLIESNKVISNKNIFDELITKFDKW